MNRADHVQAVLDEVYGEAVAGPAFSQMLADAIHDGATETVVCERLDRAGIALADHPDTHTTARRLIEAVREP